MSRATLCAHEIERRRICSMRRRTTRPPPHVDAKTRKRHRALIAFARLVASRARQSERWVAKGGERHASCKARARGPRAAGGRFARRRLCATQPNDAQSPTLCEDANRKRAAALLAIVRLNDCRLLRPNQSSFADLIIFVNVDTLARYFFLQLVADSCLFTINPSPAARSHIRLIVASSFQLNAKPHDDCEKCVSAPFC